MCKTPLLSLLLEVGVTIFWSIVCSRKLEPKGAGSYSGQGGGIARKGHPGRRKRIAGSGGVSRGQRGRIIQKRHFAMFCYYNFLLIFAQSKHQKFGALLSPRKRGAGAVTNCPVRLA